MTRQSIHVKNDTSMNDMLLSAMEVLRNAGLKEQFCELSYCSLNVMAFNDMMELVLEFVDVDRG